MQDVGGDTMVDDAGEVSMATEVVVAQLGISVEPVDAVLAQVASLRRGGPNSPNIAGHLMGGSSKTDVSQVVSKMVESKYATFTITVQDLQPTSHQAVGHYLD
ncbi:hypothetical protein HK104_003424 [Borealophlyctis nickersoniae]|nr:hypothetical protein HK104_003424 [Borealophlyctis nickersoniae]